MRLMNRLLTALLFTAVIVTSLAVLGPATGRYRTTTVLSGSMRPTMNPGDVVVAVPTDSTDLREGDIVTFQLPDGSGNVTHRIVDVDRTGEELKVTTKGDANRNSDSVTFVGDTAWRTEAVLPKIGYAFVAARAVLEQQLYMPAIGLLLGLSLLWTIWSPARKEAHASAS